MSADATGGAGGGEGYRCWMCAGQGRTVIIEGGALLTCPMCGGTGMVSVLPRTSGEMVAMITALPQVPRRTFNAEDQARIAEIEQIVIACLREMEAEEGVPVQPTAPKGGP